MNNRKRRKVVKVVILLLLVACVVLAFVGVEPFVGVKDKLAVKLLLYIQSPIRTEMVVEDTRTAKGFAYHLIVTIAPTSTARLDKAYIVEVSSPYWEFSYKWDILWSENPELKAPEARGFKEITRTILIGQSDSLYSHISQLEYQMSLKLLGGYTYREVEEDFKCELAELVKIKVVR